MVEQARYLLCKECKTLIKVYHPYRKAKCCDIEMTPLVETDSPSNTGTNKNEG